MKKILILLMYISSIMIAGNLEEDKKWAVGVHISPLPYVSISRYIHEKNIELELTTAYNEGDGSIRGAIKTWTSDIHIRQYRHHHIGGLYYSGFMRYSHMDGPLTGDYRWAKVDKLGLGIGVGYKRFFKLGNLSCYWSLGLNVGVFLLGENNIYEEEMFDVMSDDPQEIINVDILKIGLTF